MKNMSYLIEYYDELFEVSSSQKKFYEELSTHFGMPTRFLRIDCGTGYFEHFLAKNGHDATGIDTSKEMLERANLRRRMPNTAVRFFQMSSLDMTRFLGKGFYHVISCLESRIIFVHDKTLRRKFFHDCHTLMHENGVLILQLLNFENFPANPMARLPERESIRSKLFSQLWENSDGTFSLKKDIELSSGKVVPLNTGETVCPVSIAELENCAHEAGFSSVEKFEDYEKKPFTKDSKTCVLICHW
ncbi:MAG: class I SAM-dependent methyltransferase [Treponema sp.]|jgi:SAM-dependent methyltransferase|nr:class I SAM-dependent methyltransferase [Treponema sp.]